MSLLKPWRQSCPPSVPLPCIRNALICENFVCALLVQCRLQIWLQQDSNLAHCCPASPLPRRYKSVPLHRGELALRRCSTTAHAGEQKMRHLCLNCGRGRLKHCTHPGRHVGFDMLVVCNCFWRPCCPHHAFSRFSTYPPIGFLSFLFSTVAPRFVVPTSCTSNVRSSQLRPRISASICCTVLPPFFHFPALVPPGRGNDDHP